MLDQKVTFCQFSATGDHLQMLQPHKWIFLWFSYDVSQLQTVKVSLGNLVKKNNNNNSIAFCDVILTGSSMFNWFSP